VIGNNRREAMKLRNGFVSNSSSTSFTFIFKGSTIEDLFKTMQKYSSYFELYYTGYPGGPIACTVQEVIEAIRQTEHTEVVPFEAWTAVQREHLESLETRINDKDLTDTYFLNLLLDESSMLAETVNHCASMDLAKNSVVFTIDFGDNHGNVSGGTIGNIMDYEGRNISIKKPDFVVFTGQNR